MIESSESLEATAPSYPVESGFEVSDTIILSPISLSMTLFLTNTPVTWKSRHGASASRVQETVKKLKDIFFSKKPVTVVTAEQTYNNMAILSIELSKTLENGTSREIPISFQEIRITESKMTTIPASYGKSGETGVNAGAASTTNSTAGTSQENSTAPSDSSNGNNSRGSALYNLADNASLVGLGGIF